MISPFFVFVNNENKLFSAKIDWCIRRESFCGFLRGFFKKPLKARFGTQFQHILTIKKHGDAVLFLCALSVGASAPNPDQRTFREKSFGNSKALPK